MNTTTEKFIQQNSPDGGFLQSDSWQKFQGSVGNKIYKIATVGFLANIIEHKLPLVGKYFYIPRGPIFRSEKKSKAEINQSLDKLFALAKKNNAGWIRVDLDNEAKLLFFRKNSEFKIVKAPHNMQPSQIFLLDIAKNKEELLKEMKAKTRYNIRLAKRKGVTCKAYDISDKEFTKNFEKFLDLVEKTASRKGVRFHSRKYYQKMIKVIPKKNLKLYIAKYQGKLIVANIVIFYGETATYLHGASADKYKNVMAPFLLQWKIILDAKESGYKKYDLGGVEVKDAVSGKKEAKGGNWQGITRFKLGFSETTRPLEFPGSYDIILNRKKYLAYKTFHKVTSYCNFLFLVKS